MNTNQIEENRKSLNIDDDFVFDFVEELGLWIIGGYGPIDIYKDGIKVELPSDSDLPEGANIFLPYLKKCDSAEGICVYKYNSPYLFVGDIDETDIYLIQCINNGTTYFACESFTLLRLFTLSANEKLVNNRPNAINDLFRADDSFTIDYVVLSKQDETGWWLINNDKYVSVKSWPSQVIWGKSYDLDYYADILLPHLSKTNKPRGLESVCYFKIPFWDGGREIKEDYIFVIKLSDNSLCFASPNQDALRSFVLNENEMIVINNDWKKAHPNDVCKLAIDETQHNNQTTIINNITVNTKSNNMTPEKIKQMLESINKSEINVKGDFVLEKHVEHEVANVEPGGIGIQNFYSNKSKKETNNVCPDCCFFYDNKEYFAIAVQQFTNVLHKHKLIPEEVDLKKMERLFLGQSCRTKYTWLGPKHILTHIIKGLTNKDNPIITTWPEGTSKWEVVSCRFIDEDGNALPKSIRQEKAGKRTQSIVDEAVKALAGHL